MLDGRLRLLLGEAADFHTRLPHASTSADTKPVELLCLFGRQGERAHLRTRIAR